MCLGPATPAAAAGRACQRWFKLVLGGRGKLELELRSLGLFF